MRRRAVTVIFTNLTADLIKAPIHQGRRTETRHPMENHRAAAYPALPATKASMKREARIQT